MGPSSLDHSRALGAYGATTGLCLSNSAIPVRRTSATPDLQHDRECQDETGGGHDAPRVHHGREGERGCENTDEEASSPGDLQDPPSDPERDDRADERPCVPPAPEHVESAPADRDRHVHASTLRTDAVPRAAFDAVCQTKLPSVFREEAW